jgi:hypothetical protein
MELPRTGSGARPAARSSRARSSAAGVDIGWPVEVDVRGRGRGPGQAAVLKLDSALLGLG